jgi:uncharacterized protein YndB with AHSA1/START domain
MKDFKKYYSIPAPPEDVYVALTNAATMKLWTGEEAEMSDVPGSEFSMWEGSICGKNLEFFPGKKIVQQWYFGEDEKPESIVSLTLHPEGTGTSVELRHSNIPDDDFKEIVEGWNHAYFGSLRDFYED